MRLILIPLAFAAAIPSAMPALADTPAYCNQQHAICRTLCTQVTQQSSAKRGNCDSGCDQSIRGCLSSGSYNFAPVEQYMPEFHKQ